MKIGIDARVLSTSRALGRYTRNIIEQLLRLDERNEYTLFVDSVGKPSAISYQPSAKVEILPSKKLLRDHFFMQSLIKRLKLDLFFHPDNTEFLLMPVPSMVTIHDVTPYKFPRLIFSKNPIVNLRQRLYFKLQRRAILKNTRKIIAVSKNTKKDIVKILGVPGEKVVVIYEGIEKHFRPIDDKKLITQVKERYGIKGDYIFYLGGLEAHKNVISLVRALSLITYHLSPITLVIGGKISGSYQELLGEAEKLGLADKVIFTGFINDRDLPALYSGAKAFVYPSLYEGFGFPVLEALACGTPVVCSNTSSLPEVGGDAALYANPKDKEEIARKILEVLNYDTQAYHSRVEKGLRWAKKFTWEKCGRETLNALEGVTP